jgi:hypothetical protein
MGTEFDATAAVDADEGFPCRFQVDGIHRAGPRALPATDAEGFFHHHAPSFSLRIGSRGTGHGTGSRITGETGLSLKARGEPARGKNADSRGVPGETMVNQPCASQGTRVTTDTSFHPRGGQDFHRLRTSPLFLCLRNIVTCSPQRHASPPAGREDPEKMRPGSMECWSTGMLEKSEKKSDHHSVTPMLHCSNWLPCPLCLSGEKIFLVLPA